MNKIRKTGAAIISLILAMAMLAGCAGGGNAGGSSAAASSAAASSAAPKQISASDFVLGYHRYLCTGDQKIIEEIKLPADLTKELDEARAKFDNITELVKESLDADVSNLIDEKALKNFMDAMTGVLAKVKATAEESANGDVVTVKLSSDTVDFATIGQTAIVGALSGIDLNGGEEALKKAMQKIFDAFADGLNKYEFPKEKKSCTVEVKKSGDSWTFVDADKATTDITSLVLDTSFQ